MNRKDAKNAKERGEFILPEAAAPSHEESNFKLYFRKSVSARPTAGFATTTEDVASYLAEVQSNAQRGPVLTGVRDSLTGEMFFKQNVAELPSDIHPLLQSRLDSYLADPELVLNPKWGVPGTHSDFLALNEALLRREALGLPVNDLSEFEMYNVSLWSNRVGTPVPRCGNCQVLTNGVTVLSGR